jgi:hypothetical protein
MKRPSSVVPIAALVALALTGCIGRVAMGDGDAVYNYDYNTKGFVRDLSAYTPAKRDMPVNFVFNGPGVTFDNVGAVLNEAGGDTGAGDMYMPIKDGSSWQQDKSGGTKDTISYACFADFAKQYTYLHIRWYGNPVQKYSYNSSFGRYVVATSHFDYRERCGDQHFGDSEKAEDWWIARLKCVGLDPVVDSVFMDNEEHTPRDKTHYMQSDGWATRVYVPKGFVPKWRC